MPVRTDKAEIRAKEASHLLSILGCIKEARAHLKSGDFGVAQGALRAVYNSLPGPMENSDYLDQKKKNHLVAIREFVFDVREKLVNYVQVQDKKVEDAMKLSCAYEELDLISKILGGFVEEWYSVEPPKS